MQTIPIIYSKIQNLKLHAGAPIIDTRGISLNETVAAVTLERLKSKTERGKVLVADTEGLNRKRFNPSFIEYCKTPGNELWLIEPIYDEEDVFDAFLGAADHLVFPYAFIKNDSVLPGIIDISDRCVPLLACRKGMAQGKDLSRLIDSLTETGFHNIMVVDMDGSISDDMWSDLSDICGGIIAYSPVRPIDNGAGIVVEDVFPPEIS